MTDETTGQIAFYAPLKPPDHPTPSGDREMARALIGAIGAGSAAPVIQAAGLRSLDTRGEPARQDAILAEARALVPRVIAAQRGARLWVTYHNYYKAPDLLGPAVSDALGIPYVLIEASRARSRLTGPWARFAAKAEAATDAADLVFYLTTLDSEALTRDRPPGQRLERLPPFLPIDALPEAAPLADGPMLSVGMMRRGDKLSSYRILAQMLERMQTPDWRLEIAGDGPARGEVAALMAPFGDRVAFLGALDRAGLQAAYRRAELFAWPGVNEAYGMVYLEAQAAGLPVLAQDRDGVRDVLAAPAEHPAPEKGPAALAARADRLLGDRAARRAAGAAARAHVAAHHLAPAATRRFWSAVTPLLEPAA